MWAGKTALICAHIFVGNHQSVWSHKDKHTNTHTQTRNLNSVVPTISPEFTLNVYIISLTVTIVANKRAHTHTQPNIRTMNCRPFTYISHSQPTSERGFIVVFPSFSSLACLPTSRFFLLSLQLYVWAGNRFMCIYSDFFFNIFSFFCLLSQRTLACMLYIK